jgi:hypothetical protein
MNAFLKNLGLILVLCGFICLVIYFAAVPDNALLVAALALEFVGILTYILINKKIE